jgi:hypothetical protein
MPEENYLPKTVLELMRDVHVIKSALYLDTSVVGNLNITRQIARLNELTEKLIELYKQTSGAEPPTPASILKPVAPGTLRNFDSRKIKRERAASSNTSSDKPSPQKKKEEKVANKLKSLNKQARKKQQKRYAKTKKVRQARKGNTSSPPPSA